MTSSVRLSQLDGRDRDAYITFGVAEQIAGKRLRSRALPIMDQNDLFGK